LGYHKQGENRQRNILEINSREEAVGYKRGRTGFVHIEWAPYQHNMVPLQVVDGGDDPHIWSCK
jgi:hypothetical protein